MSRSVRPHLRVLLMTVVSSTVLLGCSLIVDADECVRDRDCRRYTDEPDAMQCNQGLCEPAEGWDCNDEGECWRTDGEGDADAGDSS